MSKEKETIEHRGFNLRVKFEYTPGATGTRDSFRGKPNAGVKLEPDEDESIELEEIELVLTTVGGTKSYTDITELLGRENRDEIEEQLWKLREERETNERS